MVIICPHCQRATYDIETEQCTVCGMHGVAGLPVLDQNAIDHFTSNVTQLLRQIGDGFQQILGPFSPRVGRGDADGIGFTEESASLISRHLRRQGISILWVMITANHSEMHSLIVANSPKGLDRGLRAVKKAAQQTRGRFEIKMPPSDA